MARIQLRRGDAAAWTTANSVLAEGEVGLELDTGKFKWGDGTTAWNDLPYIGGSSDAPTWIQSTSATLGLSASQGVDLELSDSSIWYKVEPITGGGGLSIFSAIVSDSAGADGTPGSDILFDFTDVFATVFPDGPGDLGFDVGAAVGTFTMQDAGPFGFARATDFGPVLKPCKQDGTSVGASFTVAEGDWLGLTVMGFITD